METLTQPFPWLALIDRPAFCVKDGTVVAINPPAEQHSIQIGTDIRQVVTEHYEQYRSFENGNLYLPITAGGITRNANVTRTEEYDVFIMENDTDDDQLRALTLAAKQLRIPLSDLMTVADRLLASLNPLDAATRKQVNSMNQGLYQILRIVSNMADAATYQNQNPTRMETVDLTAVFDEIMEKIQSSSDCLNICLQYSGPKEPIFGLANSEKLERAVYNILSNALKFTPKEGCIDATLSKNGNHLAFTVCNTTAEPCTDTSFRNRYRREPVIEETRFGLGLGMTLIQAAASSHKGTVLIDHPLPDKTRVTMTIAILKDNSGNIRSPIMRIGDYAGGRDKGLLELSEILPAAAYDNTN